MPKLNDGEVQITLPDGEVLTLKASLQAALTVSALHGGFEPTYEKTRALDLATIIAVIRAGTGVVGKDATAQAEKVWRSDAGLGKYWVELSTYINNLARGGRSAEDETKPADEGNASS